MARFHEKLKSDMYKAMVYQKKRLQEGGTWLEIFLYCPAPPRISLHLRKVVLLLNNNIFCIKIKSRKIQDKWYFFKIFPLKRIAK